MSLFHSQLGTITARVCASNAASLNSYLPLRNTPSKGIVLVVSPLTALMKDQVATMSAKGLSVGRVARESSDSERSMAGVY